MCHELFEEDHLVLMVNLYNQPELIAANIEDRVYSIPDSDAIGIRINLSISSRLPHSVFDATLSQASTSLAAARCLFSEHAPTSFFRLMTCNLEPYLHKKEYSSQFCELSTRRFLNG